MLDLTGRKPVFFILHPILHPKTDFLEGFGAELLAVVGHVVVDVKDHFFVRVAHHFDADFDVDTGVAAHGTEAVAEIVGADGGADPGRQLAAGGQEGLVLAGAAVPAGAGREMVQGALQVALVAFPGAIVGGTGHGLALGGRGDQALDPPQLLLQDREEDHLARREVVFAAVFDHLVAVEGVGLPHMDDFALEIHVPGHVDGAGLLGAQAGVQHQHHQRAEAVPGRVDRLALLLGDIAVRARLALRRVHGLVFCGVVGDHLLGDGAVQDRAHQVFRLADVAGRVTGQAGVGSRDIVRRQVADRDLMDRSEHLLHDAGVLVVGLGRDIGTVGRQPLQGVSAEGPPAAGGQLSEHLLADVFLFLREALGFIAASAAPELLTVIFQTEAAVLAALQVLLLNPWHCCGTLRRRKRRRRRRCRSSCRRERQKLRYRSPFCSRRRFR